MATDWDIFIDEVKDGGSLRGIGALVVNVGVAEGLCSQLAKPISKREGSSGKIGEIHWGDLSNIEAEVAKEWVTAFLRGPLMFYVYVCAKNGETKLKACQRLIEHLECDLRVPGELSRGTSTLHLDIDDSDPPNILRDLRRSFGLLRAFKWDSKGSLLLQLSDVLLGLARMDRDAFLDSSKKMDSKAKKRKKEILDEARSIARQQADRDKINAVIELSACNQVRYCLLGI